MRLRGVNVVEAGRAKVRGLLVARLQASQVVGFKRCPWLRCLCASVCRSVSYLNPADAGSV